jgi:hypothetical protein
MPHIHRGSVQITEEFERKKEIIHREATQAVAKRIRERGAFLQRIPGFWPTALRRSRVKDYLTEDDEKLLEYLVHVRSFLSAIFDGSIAFLHPCNSNAGHAAGGSS